MELKGSVTNQVLFEDNAGDIGTLILDNSHAFAGTVAGFYNDGTNSDQLVLQDINASSAKWSFIENANGKQGVLTVSDSSGDIARITLLGQYLAAGKSASSGAGSTLFETAKDSVTGTGGTLVTTCHASH
jgi:hypothetical protein